MSDDALISDDTLARFKRTESTPCESCGETEYHDVDCPVMQPTDDGGTR